jgi:EAL domain-containing protein (putative c-di-GMP-specific phosphodiesterase class I)
MLRGLLIVPEDAVEDQRPEGAIKSATFGRRKVRPRVCIADGKQHIRKFLGEALEEIGFITCECTQVAELDAALDAQLSDLVVVGLSSGGVEAAAILKVLAARAYSGEVLLLGPRSSSVVAAVQELGEQLDLAMLPVLATPFGIEGLRDSVATLLPTDAPPSPPVDVLEALDAGWVELWYQPKFDTRTLQLSGAEALIRVRHPTWGIVSPAYFLPDAGDSHFRAISDFVIGQAISDWHNFITERRGVEISINLSISFLRDPESVAGLCRKMPDHSAFEGLIIEIDAADVFHNMDLAKAVARQVRFSNIAVSIDDLGSEWPSLVGLHDFPFVEIKVDQQFITGCAKDRLKQTNGRQILELADGFGARTVAEGVETQADFLAVREMGFDVVQGFLFGKPMTAKQFMLTTLRGA